jgi:hypothetical protein
MRSSMARSDGMGWGLWLGVIVAVLVVAAAIGLTIYGGTVRPVQHQVERVLPNDRFPN